jgi:uncharacterized protein
VLWRVASGILTVGPLAEALSAGPRARGPAGAWLSRRSRGAFGLDFETVEVETPLGPAPAWYVPGERDMGAVYVHGIAGAREDGYRALSMLSEAGYPCS